MIRVVENNEIENHNDLTNCIASIMLSENQVTSNLETIQKVLKRAIAIIYLFDDNDGIIAFKVLKKPFKKYLKKLGEQFGIDLSDYLESGYTYVFPKHRRKGIDSELTKLMLSLYDDCKIYATTKNSIITHKLSAMSFEIINEIEGVTLLINKR